MERYSKLTTKNLHHIKIVGENVSISVNTKQGVWLTIPMVAKGTIADAINKKSLPCSYGSEHGSYYLTDIEINYLQSQL